VLHQKWADLRRQQATTGLAHRRLRGNDRYGPGRSSRISLGLGTPRNAIPTGAVSPDPDRLEPLGFPPPWPTRPWIYSNLITSRNGIVAWKWKGAHDDPVRAIAGGDFSRSGRLADRQLMRYLRACVDAVGAQTLHDQPSLIETSGDITGELGEILNHCDLLP
jgi:hypothetical protein